MSPDPASTMTADVERGQAVLATTPGMDCKTTVTIAEAEIVQPTSPMRMRTKVNVILHSLIFTISILLLVRHFVPHLLLVFKSSVLALVPDCTFVEWDHDPEGAIHISPYEHVAQASVRFPLDSDELFFISRGSSDLARGSINISDDGEPGSDVVTIDILAYYNSRHFFQRLTKVCELIPGEGRNGIGIFAVPEAEYHRTQFAVHVRLPPPIANSKTSVKELTTQLPAFWHKLEDLKSTTRFHELSMSTENASIYVDSVVAHTVSAHSTNGLIRGYFNVFHSLDLETQNGPLTALIGLLNDNGTESTKTRLHTINGDLRANVSLFATTDTGTGGLFDVAVNGTNSPVHVIFPHAPADHVLALTAHTDCLSLDLTLHPAFEGNFSVQGLRRSVAVHTAVEDPAGRGRRRQADWAQGPRWPQVGDVNGTVRWLPAGRRQLGEVTASTLVGDVTLRL